MVAAAPGVILARPDAGAVAAGLALLAGMSAFVQEDTPGVHDLYGPDAPSGPAYPFYVLQVGPGILLGTGIGAAFGAGLYLGVFHTDALAAVAETPGPGAARAPIGVVAANPGALVGALVVGALGFRSGYTGRIWASSSGRRHGHHGHHVRREYLRPLGLREVRVRMPVSTRPPPPTFLSSLWLLVVEMHATDSPVRVRVPADRTRDDAAAGRRTTGWTSA